MASSTHIQSLAPSLVTTPSLLFSSTNQILMLKAKPKKREEPPLQWSGISSVNWICSSVISATTIKSPLTIPQFNNSKLHSPSVSRMSGSHHPVSSHFFHEPNSNVEGKAEEKRRATPPE